MAPTMQNTLFPRPCTCMSQEEENSIEEQERTDGRTIARSAPNRCLNGFVVVAPNAAAGAPCHARVLVTGGRVRSG